MRIKLSKEEEMIDRALAKSRERQKRNGNKTYTLEEVREFVRKITNGEEIFID